MKCLPFQFTIIVLIMLLSTLVMVGAERDSKSLMCEVSGTCILCRKDEMENEYCKETGRRIRIKCKEGKEEFDDFKSCLRTADDDQIQVIVFQVIMGLIGGLAYWGVQARKKNTLSLFDHRKLRYIFSV
jgi:hypothetical protein